MDTGTAPPRRRAFPIPTPLRLARLSLGVTLAESARAAGLTLIRASEVERFPERARPDEIERLRRATERIAGRSIA
jgi:hypothetical protein